MLSYLEGSYGQADVVLHLQARDCRHAKLLQVHSVRLRAACQALNDTGQTHTIAQVHAQIGQLKRKEGGAEVMRLPTFRSRAKHCSYAYFKEAMP